MDLQGFPRSVQNPYHAGMRRPAEIRRLQARARKVAAVARTAGPTGVAYAEMIDELNEVIDDYREELRHWRHEDWAEKARKK